MCGITGIYAFNMVGRVSMIHLAKATEALSSRGPDFQNTYNDNQVGLGHRRLSILDPTPDGHQPMADPSGRYRIVFNGEIFNFRELRKELELQGEIFTSQSDTEVLLRLFIREGKACLSRLNGFFAFAIYDLKEQSVFLAVDRYGIKPLYYLLDQDRLLFGSELKAIMQYGVDKRIDFTALYTYLQLNYIPAPRTIFAGISKLQPGECLELNRESYAISHWYELPYSPARLTEETYDQQKQTFASLLEGSVRKRLVSDVPLGSFLSGGIDSSVIAALAVRHKPDLHTFSIGYRDEKFFDETSYAESVARKIGSKHHVFSLTNRDMFQHIHDILEYIDEPFADSSAIAVYILSRETRKYATVALSGDGADELLGGYNKHAAFQQMILGGTRVNMISALGPVWKMLPKSRHSRLGNLFRQLDRFARGKKLQARDRYWTWATFVSESGAGKLLRNDIRSQLDLTSFLTYKNQFVDHIPEKESLNDLLLADIKLVLPGDMLTKVDRMSMANSLEVRVPFLDVEVVEYCMRLPVESKINSGVRKRILQDTFRDILPEELYNRPKKGFEVPLLQWLRTDLRRMIEEDLLSDDFVKEQGIFDVQEISRLRRKLFSNNPGDIHARIWGLLVFQSVYKRYFC